MAELSKMTTFIVQYRYNEVLVMYHVFKTFYVKVKVMEHNIYIYRHEVAINRIKQLIVSFMF